MSDHLSVLGSAHPLKHLFYTLLSPGLCSSAETSVLHAVMMRFPLLVIAAFSAAAAAGFEPNFHRFLDEVSLSYQSGETSPYVELIRENLHVDRLLDIVRERTGKVRRGDVDPEVLQLSCLECDFFINNILKEFYGGTPLDVIEEQALEICLVLDLYPEEVCRGTISLAAPDLADLLTVRANTTGADICTFALGAQCRADIWPDWEVQLPGGKPPRAPLSLPEPSEVKTLKFVQLSDPHVDFEYSEGSVTECGMPMCCRASQQPITNATYPPAGHYGSYASCDIPQRTLEATLAWVAEHHSDATAIYMTGDLPAHDIWNQTIERNTASIRNSIALLKSYFPDTPVFSSIGNHAPCFIDIYPPESTWSATNNISWLSDTFGELWPTMFPTPLEADADAESRGTSVDRGSYYATRFLPGQLRVISINSNFCNSLNWWLLADSVDPSGELQWLVDQLYEAEQLGEKVHILSHIPPGGGDCLPVWSHQLTRIVDRFEDTIAAQLYGHTHEDQFEVFYSLEDDQRAVGVALIAPAVTTYSYLNPAVRVFTVDAETTWRPLEYETYIMNLTLANTEGDTSFRKLYSARDDLLEAPLTPQSYHDLVERMKVDRAKFDQYTKYFWHSDVRQAMEGHCDEACRAWRICQADSADSSHLRC